ncbi:NTF2-like protein [Peniophora sp. CONT]|nr:NTF2-like protein [Peniophora sp. CONT]
MKDLAAPKKDAARARSHRPKLINEIKGEAGPSRARVTPGVGSLNIRGASAGGSGRDAARAAVATRLQRTLLSKAKPALKQAKPLEVWRDFVNRRYNAEIGFLNLERMQEDQTLKDAKLFPPGHPRSTDKEGSVIFKMAAQLKPPVTTISLAHNHLQSLSKVATIAHYLPDIVNLSLEGNNLRIWKDLDTISALTDRKDKLSKLKELILIGNPIREDDIKAGKLEAYRSGIARRFPSLEMLDQEPMTRIAFASEPGASGTPPVHVGELPASLIFPADMCPSFITGLNGNEAIIPNFLTRFFKLFDDERAALAEVYSDHATFSFQAQTSIPARARIQGFQHKLPNQTKLEWSPWLASGSRNLMRVSQQPGKLLSSMHFGRDAAVSTVMKLPGTKHDITGSAEKFCLDAWPVAETLFLSVHGQFEEKANHGLRSFDRSFVLGAPADGSRAKLAGWDLEILSDQLVVRNYSSHEAWKPGPMLVQAVDEQGAAQAMAQLPPAVQAPLQALPEHQRAPMAQLIARTRLKGEFAFDCLDNSGWNLDNAFKKFEQVKCAGRPEDVPASIRRYSNPLFLCFWIEAYDLSTCLFGTDVRSESVLY